MDIWCIILDTANAVWQSRETFATPIAVIVAALIGSNTFKNWRKQNLSERKINQAERILTATYNARRGLRIVRNNATMAHELEQAEERLKELDQWNDIPENARNRHKQAHVYFYRITSRQEDRRALDVCQPMARALFGGGLERAVEKLNHQFHSVGVYAHAHTYDPNELDNKFKNEIFEALYEGISLEKGKVNAMDQTIADQLDIIEGICLPVLRDNGKRSLWKRWVRSN